MLYWFKKEYKSCTIGAFGPGFGVRECSDMLFDIHERHTNKKGLWLKDPKIRKIDQETKITKSQFKDSQRKTVRETIELLCIAGFPRQKMGPYAYQRTKRGDHYATRPFWQRKLKEEEKQLKKSYESYYWTFKGADEMKLTMWLSRKKNFNGGYELQIVTSPPRGIYLEKDEKLFEILKG